MKLGHEDCRWEIHCNFINYVKNCTWYPLGETRKQKQKEIIFLTYTLPFMVLVFVILTLAFQCLSLHSLVTLSKKVYTMESRSKSDSNASYLKQLANSSLGTMDNESESVNISKVSTTWKTNHSYTNDEVFRLWWD